MIFSIKIKKHALKYLKSLDKKRKSRLSELISTLKTDPVPFKAFDVAKLKGYDNFYRIRLGDLRIVYEVLWKEKRIVIHFIGPREKAY